MVVIFFNREKQSVLKWRELKANKDLENTASPLIMIPKFIIGGAFH